MLMPTSGHRSGPLLDWGLPRLIGSYLLGLFSVVAGLLFFPFSDVLMVLLFFLVGSFFLVSLIILSATSFLLAVGFFRAIRQALFGRHNSYAIGIASRRGDRQHKPGLAGASSDLWDRWLDES